MKVEISVLVLTYNHKAYIEKCLDSIVNQKIDIPYEIIILDDASTDGTTEVVKKYQKKYSQIKLLLRKNNSMYPTKNMYELCKAARGKYCAWCEGDDYWTDEYKLRKQYQFMEENAQYSACFSKSCVVDENGKLIGNCEIVPKEKENNEYNIDDFRLLSNPGMTAAFFCRNYFNSKNFSIIYKADRNMGDITMFMLAIVHGSFYQLEDEMSAYRYVRRSGGQSFNSIQCENKYKEYNLFKYWCILQQYMQNSYDENFCFSNLPYVFSSLSKRMPLLAMFSTIVQYLPLRYIVLLLFQKIYFLPLSVLVQRNTELLKGKHANWKRFMYEKKKIIIWGAGSLAAEYLDDFAWKNNVLFLTDNNRNLYQTSYKGYLVKSPEEIIKYKDKIVVLIANDKHEIEIAKQLESMGIENYYGYYSMLRKRVVSRLLRKFIKNI